MFIKICLSTSNFVLNKLVLVLLIDIPKINLPADFKIDIPVNIALF